MAATVHYYKVCLEKKVSKYPNPDDADDKVSLPKYLTLQTGHQILK